LKEPLQYSLNSLGKPGKSVLSLPNLAKKWKESMTVKVNI
jgi:hypothetical protein